MLCKRKIADTDIEMIYIEDEIIGKSLSKTGYWEQELTEWFKHYIVSQNKLFTFIDIGAHAGYFSLLAAGLNEKCYVLAFEPNPIQNAILNLNADNYDNLFVTDSAYYYGKDWNRIKMYGSLSNTGDNGTNQQDYIYYANKDCIISTDVSYKTRTTISLIKIDTQGSEYTIFQQIQKELNKHLFQEQKIIYIVEDDVKTGKFVKWLQRKEIPYQIFLHHGAPNKNEGDIVFQC